MNYPSTFVAAAVCLVALTVPATVSAQLSGDVSGDAHDIAPCAIPLERPLRAVHIGGNWATNRERVEVWDRDRSVPLIPADYVRYLRSLRVNWVGLSVALHYDDSMDSTVQRAYSRRRGIPTFADRALRQVVREFRRYGFDVYLTLAFESSEAETAARPVQRWQLGDPGDPDTGVPSDPAENANAIQPEHWPWRPTHPDHARFVRRFWRTYTTQALHYASIAQAEDVRMFSLGTETDRLFRTRSGGDYWINDFNHELRTLVERVRAVYRGLLTYDMHISAVTEDWFEPGSKYLWEDLDLDVVGLSAWIPLTETMPTTVMRVGTLQRVYDRVFREHILPLAAENTGRPIVFTEYGAMDTVDAPVDPGDSRREGERFVFTDANGNGTDDGRETQANIVRAFFRTMDRYPGVVYGAFFWNNLLASNEHWRSYWAHRRGYSLRNRGAGVVVRRQYGCYERR